LQEPETNDKTANAVRMARLNVNNHTQLKTKVMSFGMKGSSSIPNMLDALEAKESGADVDLSMYRAVDNHNAKKTRKRGFRGW
jgi:hypothetical protein